MKYIAPFTSKFARLTFCLTLLFCLLPAVGSALPASSSLPHTFAANAPASTACKKSDFFGLKPWYQYLDKEFDHAANSSCDLKCFNVFPVENGNNDCGQNQSDIPLVLLAVIDDLLRIAGIVAVAYVIFGGFKYVSSQGNPEDTSKAQGTIINALIGMAVATVALLVVSFIGNAVG